VEELVPAIRGNDLPRLTKIPGVGRKTAERMVVELKDRLDAISAEVISKPSAAAGGAVSDIEADVVSALVNLGYDARAAEEAAAAGTKAVGAANLEKLLRATLSALSAPGKRKQTT
jgi:holliday junction DNA helicase RuvA